MLKKLPPDAAKHIIWPLRLTRLGMGSEGLLRAFWPFLTLMMTCAALIFSGGIAALPGAWGLGILITFVLAMLLALGFGLRHLRLPTKHDARTRLDATLQGQPLAALADHQAIGTEDAASRAVWQAHQVRMTARLKHARAAKPDLRLAARDPYALRYMALLALVMALGFGAVFRAGDLTALLLAQQGGTPMTTASWEGWITPPAYTGKPSLYLNDQPPGPLQVPQGSRMIVRFYGKLGDLNLSEMVSGQTDSQTDPQSNFSFDITQSGALIIEGPGATSWQVTAIVDTAPTIQVAGNLTRTLAGDLEQGFRATDDYGVASGQATFTLDLASVGRTYGRAIEPEPRIDLTLQLPLPFRGDRTEVSQVMGENFAQHPWANLPVLLTLSVMDDSGQNGFSVPLAVTLPGRRFLDPLAMALIEQRQSLLWNRANAAHTAQILRAVSNRPDGFFDREGTYLTLRVLVRRLENGVKLGLSDVVLNEITQGLWDIAVGIEDDNLDDALEALRRAEERLSEAMKQGASEEELAELMDELRDAMRDYTDQLAQSGQEEGEQTAENGERQEITQDDLDAMMDAIEQAMHEGREAEAQAMLKELAEMMENMQIAEGGQGQGGESPGDQAMQGLADSLDEQQGLSDESFRDYQEQGGSSAQAGESEGNTGREGGKGRGQSHDGTGDSGDGEGGSRGELSERQSQLADEIGRQRGELPGAGSEGGDAARQALEDAQRAMNEAAEGLAQGDLSGALDKQAEAMEALREGMRELDNAMAEAAGEREGEQGATGGESGTARMNDPLGRASESQGGVAGDAPLQAGPDVYRRAEALMEDIRRRAGDRTRPEVERDYLQRLLDRF